ncbi:response regulator transcription factor [Cohnella silvisoli]|uniref:Response regulator transcription factor n=1 Tax=Cohnella silvisoli TaxID=2873699 RepID=A0ABV1KPC4_9BACL|nr:response regulator transcription factor [Cohnella silvisoli]MCD9021079.1 response regulator transcription factor [Cohnella silvisoli]
MKSSEAAILVVDDEREITGLITLYLQREGFTVHTSDNGEDALRIAETLIPDLILLDVSLGRTDGIEVCRTLRQGVCANVPILFLSCKSEDRDIVRGLSEGGDDYITKPFSPSQLVARVQAHIRRRRTRERVNEEQIVNINFPGLDIDFRSMEVRLEGELISLSAKEFELLCVLARQPNRVFPLEELYQRVWHSDSMGDTRTLMVHISNLRKKMEIDPSRPRWVQTVRGFGYRFCPDNNCEERSSIPN